MSSPPDDLDSLLEESRAMLGQPKPQPVSRVAPQTRASAPDDLDGLLQESRQLLGTKQAPVVKAPEKYRIEEPGILPSGGKGLDRVVGREPSQALSDLNPTDRSRRFVDPNVNAANDRNKAIARSRRLGEKLPESPSLYTDTRDLMTGVYKGAQEAEDKAYGNSVPASFITNRPTNLLNAAQGANEALGGGLPLQRQEQLDEEIQPTAGNQFYRAAGRQVPFTAATLGAGTVIKGGGLAAEVGKGILAGGGTELLKSIGSGELENDPLAASGHIAREAGTAAVGFGLPGLGRTKLQGALLGIGGAAATKKILGGDLFEYAQPGETDQSQSDRIARNVENASHLIIPGVMGAFQARPNDAIAPRGEPGPPAQLIDQLSQPPTIQPRQPAQINQRVAAEPKPFQPLRGNEVQPVVNGERVPRTLIDPDAVQPTPPKFEPMIKPRQPVEQPLPIGDQITEKIPIQPQRNLSTTGPQPVRPVETQIEARPVAPISRPPIEATFRTPHPDAVATMPEEQLGPLFDRLNRTPNGPGDSEQAAMRAIEDRVFYEQLPDGTKKERSIADRDRIATQMGFSSAGENFDPAQAAQHFQSLPDDTRVFSRIGELVDQGHSYNEIVEMAKNDSEIGAILDEYINDPARQTKIDALTENPNVGQPTTLGQFNQRIRDAYRRYEEATDPEQKKVIAKEMATTEAARDFRFPKESQPAQPLDVVARMRQSGTMDSVDIANRRAVNAQQPAASPVRPAEHAGEAQASQPVSGRSNAPQEISPAESAGTGAGTSPAGQQPLTPSRPAQEVKPALVKPPPTTSKPLPEGIAPQGKVRVIKPLYEMNEQELKDAYNEAKNADINIEESIFGAEGAKRYRTLQRKANSRFASHEETNAASDEIAAMESGLSERQRNRLFGIGEPEGLHNLEDIEAFRKGAGGYDYSSPDEMAESIKYDVSKLAQAKDNDPANMSLAQQVAYSRVMRAAEAATEQGWNFDGIFKDSIRKASARWADPEDARFMLQKFMKGKSSPEPAPEPTLRKLPPTKRLLSESISISSHPVLDKLLSSLKDGKHTEILKSGEQRELGTWLRAQAEAGKAEKVEGGRSGADYIIDTPKGRVRIGARGIETDIRTVDSVKPTSTAPINKPTTFKPVATGKESKATTERGTEIKTRFAIVEADQLNTSHDTQLKQNPNYPQELQPRDRSRAASEEQIARIAGQLRPEFLADSPKASDGAPIIGDDYAVESGNGRSIALRRAYEKNSDKATAYKQYLIDHAEEFGLDRKAIEQAKNPVLVRVRQSKVDRAKFTAEANESSVARMSPLEQARADAKQVKGDLLNRFYPTEDGEIFTAANRKGFIPEFLDKVVGPDHGAYLDKDGNLNQDGIKRIRDAVFASVYGDTPEGVRILQKISESPDSNIKAVANALLKNANKFAGLKDSDLDITPDLMKAVAKLSSLREQGQSVADYLKQQSMFGDDLDPLQKDILRAIDANKRSTKAISDILGKYADSAKPTGSLLEAPTVDKATLFEKAIKDGDEQTSFFQSPQARRIEAKLSTDELPVKLRAVPGQRYSSEGTANVKPSAAHVVGPNRTRVAREFAESFGRPQEEIDAVMTVGDAIASTWAKREGKTADEFYARLKVEKGYHPNPAFKGVTDLRTFEADGKAVIQALNNPDATTALHELAHVARRYLPETDQKVINDWVNLILGKRGFDSKGRLTALAEEKFARGFEKYQHEGKPPTTKIAKVFESIKGWMSDVYGSILKRGNPINVPITDEVRGVFDRMLGGKGDGLRPEQIRVSAGGENRPSGVAGERPAPITTGTGGDGVAESTARSASNDITSSASAPVNSQPDSARVESASAGSKVRSVYDSAKPYLAKPLEETLKPEEYSKLTNKEAFAQARTQIANDPKGSLASALSIESTKQSSAIQNAISMEMIREAQAQGDFSQARYLIDALAQRATDAGQAVQILSNISRISPEGVVNYANGVLKRSAAKLDTSKRADSVSKKIIDALNKGDAPEKVINKLFQKATGARRDQAALLIDKVKNAKTPAERDLKVKEYVNKRFKVPQVDDALAKELYDMASKAQSLQGYDRQVALHEMMKKIGDQLPSTLAQKGNFILRAIDLLNPSGGLLNTASDIAYGSPLGIEAISNQVAAGVDYAGKKLGIFKERSMARPEIGQTIKDYKTGLGQSLGEIKKGIDTTQTIEKSRGVSASNPFKGRLAQWFEKGIRLGYGTTQNANWKVAYADSLRSQIKASELNGRAVAEPTADMLAVAHAEADSRALADKNFISQSLKYMQTGLNKLSTLGASSEIGLGTALITYTQVPGALIKKGFEFSPAGLVTDVAPKIVKYVKARNSGEVVDTVNAQRQLVQSIARVAVGSVGVIGMSALLSKAGVLVKQSDEKGTEKLGRLQGETGVNGYRLNMNGLVRYAATGFRDPSVAKLRDGDTLLNYEFLQPFAFLMNFGANINETAGRAAKGDVKDTAWEAVKNLGTATGETMSDIGIVKNLMDAAKSGGKNGLFERTLQNLALRPTPALLRQLRNYSDNTQRMTETFGDRVKANIPGKSKELPPYRTAFGEERERMTGGSGLVRSFVLGGRTSTYKTDPETEYAADLFKGRDDKERGSHIPTPPAKYTDAQGNEHKLTARQKSDAQESIGKNAREAYRMQMNSKEAQQLSANDKGKQIEGMLGPIRERAKIDILKQPEKPDSPKAGQIVPRDPAIFDHNSKVTRSHTDAVNSLKSDPALKASFDQLKPEQREYAIRRINETFDKAKVDELQLPQYMTKESALQRGQWALRGSFSNNAIKMILENAKYYTKAKR